MRTIPLPKGLSHLEFDVSLSGTRLRIRFDWMTRLEYYVATIQRGGETLLAGRGVHPDIDLLRGLRLGIGALYMSGSSPTPDNLGGNAKLIYDEDG